MFCILYTYPVHLNLNVSETLGLLADLVAHQGIAQAPSPWGGGLAPMRIADRTSEDLGCEI